MVNGGCSIKNCHMHLCDWSICLALPCLACMIPSVYLLLSVVTVANERQWWQVNKTDATIMICILLL